VTLTVIFLKTINKKDMVMEDKIKVTASVGIKNKE